MPVARRKTTLIENGDPSRITNVASSSKTMANTSAAATNQATTTNSRNPLPVVVVGYNAKLEKLSKAVPELASITTAELLNIAREILHALYTKKEEWGKAENWPCEEMKLYKLADSTCGINGESSTKLNFGLCLASFLKTTIDSLALELKSQQQEGPKQDNNAAKHWFRQKRVITLALDGIPRTVYGPIPTVLLGNKFESWCLSTDDNNQESKEPN